MTVERLGASSLKPRVSTAVNVWHPQKEGQGAWWILKPECHNRVRRMYW